jgi:CrcB protein
VDEAMRYASVAAGAMLVANLPYIIGTLSAERWGAEFPYGTLSINVTGAFVIGVFLALIGELVEVNPLRRLFFATGFVGGYTTFSSYVWEALALAEGGAYIRGALYVLASNGAWLLGVWLGATLVRQAPL